MHRSTLANSVSLPLVPVPVPVHSSTATTGAVLFIIASAGRVACLINSRHRRNGYHRFLYHRCRCRCHFFFNSIHRHNFCQVFQIAHAYAGAGNFFHFPRQYRLRQLTIPVQFSGAAATTGASLSKLHPNLCGTNDSAVIGVNFSIDKISDQYIRR